MKEALVDMFELCGLADVLCLTTNGTLKKNGAGVMGRGVALTARDLWPGVDYILGAGIRAKGNVPIFLGWVNRERWLLSDRENPPPVPCGQIPSLYGYTELWSFPVKHAWDQPADLALIEYSAWFLADHFGDRDLEIVLPRPGCGNGNRSWEEVAPVLHWLDDRFTVVDLPR